MKNTLIIFVTMVAIVTGCTTSTYDSHGIPNFSEVSAGIYRGGQPTIKGWLYLQSIGVKNVVKLNSYAEGDSDNFATALGMTVYCYPISLSQQIIGEPQRNVLQAACAMTLPLSGSVFVHCTHGQDRTGLLIGIYRREVQGWSKADAEKEMLEHGFHPYLRGLYWSWEEWPSAN